jgi:hypothetical protein
MEQRNMEASSSRGVLVLSFNYKTLLIYTALIAVLTYSLVPRIKETKTEIKVQERVRTVTRIVENKDGSRETVIEQVKDLQSSNKTATSMADKWRISATMTAGSILIPVPTYGLGVSRELILGVSGGLYGTTSGQLGVILNYSF